MAANVSQGAKLYKTVSSTLTEIGDITGISVAGITRTEMDVTSLADTAKKFLMGTTDAGTIEIQFNYDDTLTVGTLSMVPGGANGTTLETVSVVYQIRVPCGYNDSSVAQSQGINFSAFQQSFSIEAAVDSQLTGSLTLRIDGAISFASCIPG
ncbi:hypothetical protein UFOVP942_31 [uncultured Caudovirales phage]|uniref:Uncharacterized protein n=1 Tax=uncultured Caudovirales phage TaxID=2100421 RepID=A0A6J5S470_9CAUD|nr:hypothetical protein UFOVP942_31 [uncultured Caudovirales phage]CAB4203245.1 hypothetical protein UFOVP1379_6 [uncultured Caudovirales phage]